MARGRFITFEGGQGVGKTTQVGLLVRALEHAGVEVTKTREPGGTDGAEVIRELLVQGTSKRWQPMAEALLHFAARCDHVARVIKPTLESGSWVICDRFTDSTIAYQGFGSELGREQIEQLEQIALPNFRPDLTFILDLPVDVAFARVEDRKRAGHRYMQLGKAFHERVRQGYLDIAESDPTRCALLDGNETPDQIHRQVVVETNRRFGISLSHSPA